jgi:hypothetical protein
MSIESAEVYAFQPIHMFAGKAKILMQSGKACKKPTPKLIADIRVLCWDKVALIRLYLLVIVIRQSVFVRSRPFHTRLIFAGKAGDYLSEATFNRPYPQTLDNAGKAC